MFEYKLLWNFCWTRQLKEFQQPLHLTGQNSKDIDLQRNPTVATPVKTGRKRKIAVCIRTGGGSRIISRAGYPTTWLFFSAITATFRSDSEQLRAICAETVFPVTNDVFCTKAGAWFPQRNVFSKIVGKWDVFTDPYLSRQLILQCIPTPISSQSSLQNLRYDSSGWCRISYNKKARVLAAGIHIFIYPDRNELDLSSSKYKLVTANDWFSSTKRPTNIY